MLKTNANTTKIISPAKVNLFLAVGEKQGHFHPVLNIMHSLLLHDVLYINYEKSNKLDISIEFLENEDSNGEIPDIKLEDNLIYKAIIALAENSKKTNYKLDIYVEKNIPLQAGLAGGSSNAAAALVGVAKIFGVDDDTVATVAAEIGSDVAFFLNGGCALYKGHGEALDHKLSPINREVVLVRPFNDQGLSTKAVYDQFDKMNLAADFETKFEGEMTLEEACVQLQFADNVPLFNNLTNASRELSPALAEVQDWLNSEAGADNVLQCGSGSATFAFSGDNINAGELEELAKSKGFWSITTQLANTKAKIVPNVTEY